MFRSVIFFSWLLWGPGQCQQVTRAVQEIAQSFDSQNYDRTVFLCSEIIEICEASIEPECYYTNFFKEIYRYKGLAEFELYKIELNYSRLSSAIESLNYSYLLFKDPEVRFLQGYLKILAAILSQSHPDLSGIVMAWEGILNLYARGQWQVGQDLIIKIKMFIPAVEKFASPNTRRHYSGSFARFSIVLACDLAERGSITDADQAYFNQIRLKYDNRAHYSGWRFDYRANSTIIPGLKKSH